MSKTLDKVSKLLNQAENAGTPEEAATFMAKAQEMASINNVDLAVARMHQAKKERAEEPEERRIRVNPQTRKRNRKHFLELAMAIANVNDVEYLISGGETSLLAVGFPSDLDVVEALYTHLAVQMATEADEALARGDHKVKKMLPKTTRVDIPWDDRDWGGWNQKTWRDYDYDDDYNRETGEYIGYKRTPNPPPKYEDVPVKDENGEVIYEEKTVSNVDGRVFRGNFYEAFVLRMKGRLWEIRKSVERHAGVEVATSETAVALRDKKEEVNQAHAAQRAQVKHLGVYKGSWEADRKQDYSGTASRAGKSSAERVPIDQEREVRK